MSKTFENATPKSVPPLERERPFAGNEKEIERTHPAFGMIGAARVSGGNMTLFGSPILHNGTVRIEIVEGREMQDSHSVRRYGGKTITVIYLSEAQWAAFVSTMNVGAGVPCTIKSRHMDNLRTMPGIEMESGLDRRRKMIADLARQKLEKLREFSARFRAMLKAPGTPTKKALAELETLLIQSIDNAPGSYEFAAEMVQEEMDGIVTAGKAELSAFAMKLATQYPEIERVAPMLQIESKEGEFLIRYLLACFSAFVHGIIETGVVERYSDDAGVMGFYEIGRSLRSAIR